MMQVKLKRTSPTYHQKGSTKQIMNDLLIGLFVMAVYSIIHEGLYQGSAYAIKAFGMYLTSVAVALIVETVWASLHKQSFKGMLNHSFPLITPIIYTLTLPIGTPLYVVAVGAFFAQFIGKLVYGGFGCNIFNPALVGRVIVHLSFASKLTNTLSSGVDTATSATPATALSSFASGTGHFSYSLTTLLFGNHGGAIGETAVIVIIAIGIILAIRRVYDARITVSYLLMAALLALVSGICNAHVGSPFVYMLEHLMAGGLLFGAFFMATDPVTSPLSPLGKIIYGLSLGFLTMLIRLKANYPEGVMFSILIMNMLTPFIDSLITGRTSENTNKQCGVVIGLMALFCVIIAGVSLSL